MKYTKFALLAFVFFISLISTMKSAFCQWAWSGRVIDLSTEGLHSPPTSVVDNDGNVTAVWLSFPNNYRSAVIQSARFANGRWLPTEDIGFYSCGSSDCDEATSQISVALISDNKGIVTALWNSQVDGVWTILSTQNINGVWDAQKVVGYSYSVVSSLNRIALRKTENNSIVAFWVKSVGTKFYLQSSELVEGNWNAAQSIAEIDPSVSDNILVWHGAIKAFVHHEYGDQRYIPVSFYRNNKWITENVGQDTRDFYGALATAVDPDTNSLIISWVHEIYSGGYNLIERSLLRNIDGLWGSEIAPPSPATPRNIWLANSFSMIGGSSGKVLAGWTQGDSSYNLSWLDGENWHKPYSLLIDSGFVFVGDSGSRKSQFDEYKSLYQVGNNNLSIFNLCSKQELYCTLNSIEIKDNHIEDKLVIDKSDPQQGEFRYSPIQYSVSDNNGSTTVIAYTSCINIYCQVRGARYFDGRWSDKSDLSTVLTRRSNPSLVVDNKGNATTLWLASTDGTDRSTIQAKRGTDELETLYSIEVSIQGIGKIKSTPSGINCDEKCVASYPEGASVSLNPIPEPGYSFDQWSGDCSGKAACMLTMNKNHRVTASFSVSSPVTLNVIRSRNGAITSTPTGINCGITGSLCKTSYVKDSSITLTSKPKDGYYLRKWVGCQSTSNDKCVLKLMKPTTVSAVFLKLPKYTLKITKDKLGSVASSPASLKCTDSKKTCSVKLPKGTEVTLTPVPQAGRTFAGWTGACSGFDPCVIKMDGNKGVGASFQ